MKHKRMVTQYFAILCCVSILCIGISHTAFAQNDVKNNTDIKRQISGVITDESGIPLSHVTIKVVGGYTTTGTDGAGKFMLTFTSSSKEVSLSLSHIAMQPLVHKVVNGQNLTIVMKSIANTISDVVVTGMETIKRDQMTGSATVLTAKDIRDRGFSNIDQILEGMVAGLNSTTTSGAPGTRAQITIRGENNLSGRTEPLWILDGLPMLDGVPENNSGDFAGTIMKDGVGNILPEDIETISILKDASAVAIYGARAANGVIVITTKKGFRSKTQISYTGSAQIGLAPHLDLDFMNSKEKLRYEKSIIDNFGLEKAQFAGRGGFLYKNAKEGYYTPAEYEVELARLENTNTNWFDEIFRTAVSQSHNMGIRGGSEELSYYSSINQNNSKGILSSNDYTNSGLRLSLDYRPAPKFTFNLTTAVNARKNVDHASVVDPFNYAVFANPYERPYDQYGNYTADLSYLPNNFTTETASGYLYDRFNIMKELQQTKNTANGLDANITLNFLYDILPGLRWQSIGRKAISYNTGMIEVDAGTYTSFFRESFAKSAYPGQKVINPLYDNGELSESSGRSDAWSLRNQLDYSFTLHNKHLFSVLVASEITSQKFNNFSYKSPSYSSDYRITGLPHFDNPGLSYEQMYGAIAGMFNTSDGQGRTASFLGSLRYSYDDRYVMNFNYRADGADVIGSGNQFTPLWSIGGRYNLHNEKFFKNDIVSELAFRGSFGYTGNIDRTAYPFSTINYSSSFYEGNRYISGLGFPNPSVKWEKKRDFNVGTDVGLFESRIMVSANYYMNRTADILENLMLPASTGRQTVKANGGIVENSGIELSLIVRWVNRPNFSFSTGANIARNKNFIKRSYYNFSSYKDAISRSVVQGGTINIEGQETGGIYGSRFAGVNPETGNPMFYMTDLGKEAYMTFLDGWEFLGTSKQGIYSKFIKDFNTVPAYIDFYEDGTLPEYFRSSLTYLGRKNPKYVGGFNTSIRFHNLEFATQWSYKVGHIVPVFNDYMSAPRNMTNSNQAAAGYSSDLFVSGTNRSRKNLGYWQMPGEETDIRRFVVDANDVWASKVTSEMYEKGDYIRMTNISLSYRIPAEQLKRFGKLTNISVAFNASNLLTFTKYSGIDVATMGAFNYPVAKGYNFRLTVGF